METPILTLTGKDFLTGINPAGAHGAGGGLFYKADGVTPLFEAGTSQSVNNGLLMAGAAGTTIGGTPNGNFTCSIGYDTGVRISAYFGTSTGHLLRQDIGTADTPPTGANLTDLHTMASDKILSLETVQSAGNQYMLYFGASSIGRYDINAATFNDTWGSANTDNTRATHKYFDTILFGNGTGALGSISAALAITSTALDLPDNTNVTAISDDGTYAVIGISNNSRGDTGAYSDTRILFWDGFSSSWLREYPITDPFIFAIKKTPQGVFAFGITGIWQVTFNGVKKVFSHPPEIYTAIGYNTHHYGKSAASYFSDALIWGAASGSNKVIKSLGKLDSAFGASYLHPFKSTANQNITLVDGQLLKGWVYVADDTPQLKAYPLSTTNSPQTSITAQTIYFPLLTKMKITRLDVIFGEPLVSGDSVTFQVKTDEDTNATPTTALSASYASDGAIRTKAIRVTGVTAEDQLSLVVNFTAGAAKIKKIKLYGTEVPTP